MKKKIKLPHIIILSWDQMQDILTEIVPLTWSQKDFSFREENLFIVTANGLIPDSFYGSAWSVLVAKI